MYRIINFTFLLFFSYFVQAQRFGNEWIVPQQSYLKLTLSKNGIYQVTGADLEKAGWQLTTLSPENLQLFHHGTEVAISIIKKGNSNNFTSEDIIEFYAEKNDGSADSLLYRPMKARTNPYYSLFTDESSYFLTIGKSTGKRIQKQQSILSKEPSETYHIANEISVFTSQYSYNNIIGLVPLLQQSYYETGEGRTGNYLIADSVNTFQVNFKNRIQIIDNQPHIEFYLNGRSRVYHLLNYQFQGQEATKIDAIEPFGIKIIQTELPETAIKNEQTSFSITSTQKEEYDWYSMSYIKATYPQKIVFEGTDTYFYLKPNPSDTSFLELPSSINLYDVTNKQQPIQIFTGSDNRWMLTNTRTSRTVFASNTVLKPTTISRVNFNNTINQNTDYLIITSESLLTAANEYAAYRATQKGGNFKPLVVTTNQLYNEFMYGERNPIAVRRFADYLLQYASPKFLLLIGKGTSFPDELRRTQYPDLVPSIGYPASDALHTAGLAGFAEDVMAIPTGRLSVTTTTEIRNYLAKVIEFEALEGSAEWRKQLLHLSGGQSLFELSQLKNTLQQLTPQVEEGILGGTVQTKTKQTDAEVEAVDITKEVNNGIGMITFAGHGSANTLDFNFGFASPPQNGFTNKGKYPIMFFNGCGVGNVFYRYNALSTDWLLTPNKGAIAVFANSFWSYLYPTERYLSKLYEKFFVDEKTVSLSLGEIQQAAHLSLANEANNEYIKANLHQIILQGDPALKIFPTEEPDYQTDNNSIFIVSKNSSQPIAANDSVQIGVIIQNLGRNTSGKTATLQLKVSSASSVINTKTFAGFARLDTVYIPIKKDKNVTKIEVLIDASQQVNELNETNNTGVLSIGNWAEIESTVSYPAGILPDNLAPILNVTFDGKIIENNAFVAANSVITLNLKDENALSKPIDEHLKLYLKKCTACTFEPVKLGVELSNKIQEITVNSTLTLEAGTYQLLAIGYDTKGNSSGKGYQIQFRIAEQKLPTEVSVFPNPAQNFIQMQYRIIDKKAPAQVTIYLYTSDGKLLHVQTQQPTIGDNQYIYPTNTLPNGVYHIKLLIDNEEITTKKVVVIK